MNNKTTHRYFWTSVCTHLLFVLSVSWVVSFKPPLDKMPATYLPAHLYQLPTPSQTPITTSGTKPVSKNGVERKNQKQTQPTFSSKVHPDLHKKKRSTWEEQSYTSEKDVTKPLLKLLHDATAQHLVYPDIAVEFNKKGVAQIGFLLEPNGEVSEVTVLHSSGFDPLDNAALSAVKAISPLRDVSRYLTAPKRLVIDVIFR